MLGAGGGSGIGRFNRLGIRLALLLSLALLPIGLIAALQTYRSLEERKREAEAALLGQTALAADRERQLIQTAIGAGRAFGVAMPQSRTDTRACSTLLGRFANASNDVAFVGFVDAAGKLICGSHSAYIDFAETKMLHGMRAEPTVTARPHRAKAGGEALILVGVPVVKRGRFLGAVSISLPASALDGSGASDLGTERPEELVVFNLQGEVLTARPDPEGLSPGRPLAEIAAAAPQVFTGTGRRPDQVFAVVPIVEGTVYALAGWPPDRAPSRARVLSVPTAAFPVLMWLASLSVAFYAMHRLVGRPIRQLQHRIRVFTSARRTLSDPDADVMPAELREVSRAFDAMTRRILADEAAAERSLVEKNVLLKEVHHRVKNNLQLISSILNMQRRRAGDEATRDILARLQGRVMGLATIHQSLQDVPALTRVRADRLIDEIVDEMLAGAQSAGGRVTVTRALEPVTLFPDQAVPLALLANEAVTNARKYVSATAGKTPWIDIRLGASDEGLARFTVRNSVDGAAPEGLSEAGGAGLGTELIDAFAVQLEGSVMREAVEDVFKLQLEFWIAEFQNAEQENQP